MTPDAREQARHNASVMIAFAEGKEIQYRKIGNQEWTNDHNPWFRWDIHDYRVKPEERKPREIQVWICDATDDVYPERYVINDTVGMGWRLVAFREVLPETETE